MKAILSAAALLLLLSTLAPPALGRDYYHRSTDAFSREEYPKTPEFDKKEGKVI